MDTLALDPDTWDLTVDAYGNWATFGTGTPGSSETGPGMRLAQDVATQCATWRGECYFDTTAGIQYEKIFGLQPNLSLVQTAYNSEALKVPECATALSNLKLATTKRVLTGTISVSDEQGNSGVLTLP